MFKLKSIEPASIPSVLAKAERYRLLNEPREADSICRDVLAVDPSNHDALVCLVLTTTDLFALGLARPTDVEPLIARLASPYDREYYMGVAQERWAKHLLGRGYSIAGVYQLLRSAMEHFDRADALAPPGNEDAVLRWNTCVRLLQREHFDPDAPHEDEVHFDDDVPMR